MLAWTLVVAYSLAPFDVSPAVLNSRVANPASLMVAPGTGGGDVVLHFAAFLLVGVLHRLSLAGGATHVKRWSIIAGLTACAAIEAGQLGVTDRHSALLDLLANGLGFLLGARMAPAAERRLRTLGDRRPSYGAWFRRTALILWALFWAVALVYPYRLVTLDGWDPSYALVVGDEVGGGREWSGEIDYVAFYDRPLDAADAAVTARLAPGTAEGAAARKQLGLIDGYEFGAAVLAAMRRHETGARVSLHDAAALIKRLAASGSFAIEVRCTPAPFPQTGPARIVGLSNGIWLRNVTLGQEGHALEFRVRNALNGPNGMTFALRSPELLTGQPVQIIAAYARGLSTIYIDGRSTGASTNLQSPAVILGLGATAVGAVAVWLIAGLSFIVCLSISVR